MLIFCVENFTNHNQTSQKHLINSHKRGRRCVELEWRLFQFCRSLWSFANSMWNSTENLIRIRYIKQSSPCARLTTTINDDAVYFTLTVTTNRSVSNQLLCLKPGSNQTNYFTCPKQTSIILRYFPVLKLW